VQRHGDHGRRLSAAERGALVARVAAGDTHAMAAAAIGCSTKFIQRLYVHTGGPSPASSTAARGRHWAGANPVKSSPGMLR
jgi:hypothetical protein